MKKKKEAGASEEHLKRVRGICMSMVGATEKLSHGAPTFFAKKDVFTMFANNHHRDGHVAVWIPAEPGLQSALIKTAPKIYFRPPHVGPSGWVGIELNEISDEDLAAHIAKAWKFIASKEKKRPRSRRARSE